MMASAGYTKSGPIPEAPAKQMGSPHRLAVEATGVSPSLVLLRGNAAGQEEWGVILQITGNSQNRNKVSDEVTPVCKVGSS